MRLQKATKIARSNTCSHCANAPVCLLPPTTQLFSELMEHFQFSSRLLKRGEHLCYQGQTSSHLYILRSGLLKSYFIKQNGEEFVMGFYFPPDLFGFEAMDETQRSVSITALDQSNICVIPTEKMFALTQHSPALGKQLLRMVGQRVHQDNTALLRTSALQRVATFLLQLASRYEKLNFQALTLPLLMTHQDIANYLHITPSTISRIFHELALKKIIEIKKHLIIFRDIAQIRQMAE